MTCAADLSTMTESEAHAACESLRQLLRIVPLTPEPTYRGETSSPCDSADVGSGDHLEMIV